MESNASLASTSAPAVDASADAKLADMKSKRAARNRKWREAHKDAIKAKRIAKFAALRADPHAWEAKRLRDRLARAKRMADPVAKERIRETRKAWRQRQRVAAASTPEAPVVAAVDA